MGNDTEKLYVISEKLSIESYATSWKATSGSSSSSFDGPQDLGRSSIVWLDKSSSWSLFCSVIIID